MPAVYVFGAWVLLMLDYVWVVTRSLLLSLRWKGLGQNGQSSCLCLPILPLPVTGNNTAHAYRDALQLVVTHTDKLVDYLKASPSSTPQNIDKLLLREAMDVIGKHLQCITVTWSKGSGGSINQEIFLAVNAKRAISCSLCRYGIFPECRSIALPAKHFHEVPDASYMLHRGVWIPEANERPEQPAISWARNNEGAEWCGCASGCHPRNWAPNAGPSEGFSNLEAWSLARGIPPESLQGRATLQAPYSLVYCTTLFDHHVGVAAIAMDPVA